MEGQSTIIHPPRMSIPSTLPSCPRINPPPHPLNPHHLITSNASQRESRLSLEFQQDVLVHHPQHLLPRHHAAVSADLLVGKLCVTATLHLQICGQSASRGKPASYVPFLTAIALAGPRLPPAVILEEALGAGGEAVG